MYLTTSGRLLENFPAGYSGSRACTGLSQPEEAELETTGITGPAGDWSPGKERELYISFFHLPPLASHGGDSRNMAMQSLLQSFDSPFIRDPPRNMVPSVVSPKHCLDLIQAQ